jgi:hypothetical protein
VPKENDLEGVQDQGGKHGGQAGMPKPVHRPKPTERDEDVSKEARIRRAMEIGSGVKKAPEAKRTLIARKTRPRARNAIGAVVLLSTNKRLVPPQAPSSSHCGGSVQLRLLGRPFRVSWRSKA